MITILRDYLLNMHLDAVKEQDQQILTFLDRNENARLLDLGCNTGDFTIRVAKNINTKHIYGVEIVETNAKKAENKGIKVTVENIENGLPFENDFFDIVCGNQIIEHLFNLDFFVKETNRVLKPEGYCVISTENLASWHNIFCLLFCKQPFSTMISRKVRSCGNPFTVHPGLRFSEGLESWAHNKILVTSSLKDLFQLYCFSWKTC